MAACVAVTTTALSQEILKSEPPAGALRYPKVVYVDDGACPKGQIKKVVGGDGKSKPRQLSCVTRPK